jgi:hypothetical protein
MDLNDGALIPCAIRPLPFVAGSYAVAEGLDKEFANSQRESVEVIFVEIQQICASVQNREARMATLCAPKFVEPARLLQIFKESRDTIVANMAQACLTKVVTCKAPSADVTTRAFLQVVLDSLADPQLHVQQRWTLAFILSALVEHNDAPIARTLRSIRGVGRTFAVAAASLQAVHNDAPKIIAQLLLLCIIDNKQGPPITAAEADDLREAAVALLQHHYHMPKLLVLLGAICEDITKAIPAAAGLFARVCAGAIRDAVATRAPTQFELLRLFAKMLGEAAVVHTAPARAAVASMLHETNALELFKPLLSLTAPSAQRQYACHAVGDFATCRFDADGTLIVRSGLLPLLTRCAAATSDLASQKAAVASLGRILSASPPPTDVTRYLVEKCKILPVLCGVALRSMQPELCEPAITCIRLAVDAAESARFAPLNEYGRNPYWALCAERYGINDTLDKIGGDKSINKNHPAVARAALQLKEHNNARLSTPGTVDEADTARYIKYAAQQSKGWHLAASDYDGDYGIQTQAAVDVSHNPASAAPSAAAPSVAAPVAARSANAPAGASTAALSAAAPTATASVAAPAAARSVAASPSAAPSVVAPTAAASTAAPSVADLAAALFGVVPSADPTSIAALASAVFAAAPAAARSAAAPGSARPVAAPAAAPSAPSVAAPSKTPSSSGGVPTGSWRFSTKKAGN